VLCERPASARPPRSGRDSPAALGDPPRDPLRDIPAGGGRWGLRGDSGTRGSGAGGWCGCGGGGRGGGGGRKGLRGRILQQPTLVGSME
jgi:hypothetical protein